MAEALAIECPTCGKSMNVPPAVVGRKIKCKQCETVFPVKAPPEEEEVPTLTEAEDEPPTLSIAADDDDNDTAYGMTETDLTPRCPHCAHELEEETQVVCLNCGYNLRSRQRIESKKVYEPTQGDYFMWWLPAIGWIGAMILLAAGCLVVHYNGKGWMEGTFFQLEGKDKWLLRPGALTFYAVLLSLFLYVPMIKFIVKRLVFNWRPPEEEFGK